MKAVDLANKSGSLDPKRPHADLKWNPLKTQVKTPSVHGGSPREPGEKGGAWILLTLQREAPRDDSQGFGSALFFSGAGKRCQFKSKAKKSGPQSSTPPLVSGTGQRFSKPPSSEQTGRRLEDRAGKRQAHESSRKERKAQAGSFTLARRGPDEQTLLLGLLSNEWLP